MITFQNFGKVFIENDTTWRNKNNKFVYTVRTPIGVNQSTYLDKISRENTFWLKQEEKVYRSVNCVYRYYTSFDHSVNLDDKIPYCFEQIRRRGFNQGTRKKRKLVYTTSEKKKRPWLWSQKLTG